MCGIVGIVSKQWNGLNAFHADIFKDLLIADSVRGLDSTGVFSIDCKNRGQLLKQAVDPHVFLRNPDTKQWLNGTPSYRLMVGHNRKATSGAVVSRNAHPFLEGHIMLVHNGMVFDHSKLNADKEVDVDSHALCHKFVEVGAEEAIGQVRGAFALVWYDLKQRALFFWRNKERPLSLMERNQDLIFASEMDMMEWIMDREDRSSQVIRSWELPPNSLVKITFDPWKITTKELKEKPLPVFENSERFSDLSHRQHAAMECGYPQGMEHWLSQQELEGPAANEDETAVRVVEVSNLDRKAIMEMYPSERDVLFHVSGKIVSWTDEPKRWEVQGRCWLPGKPSFKAKLYTPEGMPLINLKAWKDARNIVAKVGAFQRTPEGEYSFQLKNAQIPKAYFVTHNKYRMSGLEWECVVRNTTCRDCGSHLDLNQPENSSVNPKENSLGVYKVVCHNCLAKKLTEEQRNAIKQGRNPSVQNSQSLSKEASEAAQRPADSTS